MTYFNNFLSLASSSESQLSLMHDENYCICKLLELSIQPKGSSLELHSIMPFQHADYLFEVHWDILILHLYKHNDYGFTLPNSMPIIKFTKIMKIKIFVMCIALFFNVRLVNYTIIIINMLKRVNNILLIS